MSDCLFCRIAKHEIKAEVIYEDDHTVAFLDISPRAPGHTLVIPKFHAGNIILLPEEEVGPLFAAVKKVSGMIVDRLKPDGLTIGINQGAASGQEVDHLHIHIFPRWTNDGGHSVQSIVNYKTEESVAEMGKKIRGEK